jgi:hypothetical protein
MTNMKSGATSTAPMHSIGGSEIDGFEVRAIRAAVVYGEKSRTVLHIHHVVTFGKQDPPSSKDVEARALTLAASELKRRGVGVAERLKALAVEPDALAAGIEYRIDERAGRLVPLTPPRKRRTRRTTSAGSKRRAKKR